MATTRMTETERQFRERYPRFYAALMALGATNPERAQALGVSRRAFAYIKQGRHAIRLTTLAERPELAEAWCADIQARHDAGPHAA